MASDSPGDGSVSVDLPESLRRWLADKAAEEGRSREDLLLQLLSAYRKVDGLEEGEVTLPPGMAPDDGLPPELQAAVEQRVDERVEAAVEELVDELVDERVEGHLADADDGVDAAALEARVDDAESRFRDLLEDVRDRVVQVKRETDAKAPADHDHPELAATVEDLEDALEALAGTDDDVEALAARVDSGFDNYEEVLEYLADSVDRVAARQTTLAKALVETREELRTLAGRDAARAAAESLQHEANQHGIRRADCESCGTAVDVGLLSRPECPHCAETFVDVEPATGYFGSDRLATGDQPALLAGDDPDDGFEYGVTAIAEDDDRDDEQSPETGADGSSEDDG